MHKETEKRHNKSDRISYGKYIPEVQFMHNEGVTCSVNECEYHVDCNKCRLEKIEVTHEKTSPDSMAVPHFCKSYKKKN